jgi:hypothetical protein
MRTDPSHDFSRLPRSASAEEGDAFDPERPLAVFLVGGEESLGPAAFGMFGSRYAKEYSQVLFLAVGIMNQSVVDSGVDGSGNFKGTEEAQRLRERARESLQSYLDGARSLGLKAACLVSVSVNAAQEISRLSDEITAAHPKAVYFLGKLVFEKPRWYHRWLHGSTSDTIRKHLEKKGHPVTVLPVVVTL